MTDDGSKQEILSRIAQTVCASSKLKDYMERQEHCPQLQNQKGAYVGHFSLPVRERNMDPYSRIRGKDTSYRNEMLPKAFGHVANEEVRNIIRHAIRSYKDLITTVKKRKLRWYGHITRSTRLTKMILQGTVQGVRRKSRQKRDGKIIIQNKQD